MPRVAICFGTFPPEHNGGADFLEHFAAALAEAGCTVHVLTSPSDAPARERLTNGVTVHRVVDDWRLLRGRHALRQVNRVLDVERIEVLHVLFPDSVVQADYQLPALVGLRRVPLVTTFWNLGLGRRSPLPVRLCSVALLLRSAAVSSHDPTYLQALRRLALGRRPVHWLPAGSNFHPVPRRRKPDGMFMLGYFGQLDFTRGVDTLFEALVLAKTEGVRLRMIGSAGRPERYAGDASALAEFERLRSLPDRLDVADAVEWTEYLTPQEVSQSLADLDLCVLPYRRNSLGRSALAAALGAGVPVVLGGRPDGIVPLRDGEHVALVPPDNPAALAAVIDRLAADEPERARLAEGAAHAEWFAWPSIAARAVELYRLALR
jgi:glycosyltransferase involved in cell wall biosynthesis